MDPDMVDNYSYASTELIYWLLITSASLATFAIWI